MAAINTLRTYPDDEVSSFDSHDQALTDVHDQTTDSEHQTPSLRETYGHMTVRYMDKVGTVEEMMEKCPYFKQMGEVALSAVIKTMLVNEETSQKSTEQPQERLLQKEVSRPKEQEIPAIKIEPKHVEIITSSIIHTSEEQIVVKEIPAYHEEESTASTAINVLNKRSEIYKSIPTPPATKQPEARPQGVEIETTGHAPEQIAIISEATQTAPKSGAIKTENEQHETAQPSTDVTEIVPQTAIENHEVTQIIVKPIVRIPEESPIIYKNIPNSYVSPPSTVEEAKPDTTNQEASIALVETIEPEGQSEIIIENDEVNVVHIPMVEMMQTHDTTEINTMDKELKEQELIVELPESSEAITTNDQTDAQIIIKDEQNESFNLPEVYENQDIEVARALAAPVEFIRLIQKQPEAEAAVTTIEIIKTVAQEQPVEASLALLAQVFVDVEVAQETPDQTLESIIEKVESISQELQEIIADSETEEITIPAKTLSKIHLLLEDLGYKNPAEALEVLFKEHDKKYLAEIMYYLAQLKNADNRQEFLLKQSRQLDGNTVLPLSKRIGSLLCGILRIAIPAPSSLN